MEILHDQLLAAFSADSALRPRDIIVMVPDIDRYARIEAVFGQLPTDDPRHIPGTLSDQASRHRLPLMIALEKLLRLPELRLTVSDVLDLLEVLALRQRFGLEERDCRCWNAGWKARASAGGSTPSSASGWNCPAG